MKKINLKSILKKTFNKKVSKKAPKKVKKIKKVEPKKIKKIVKIKVQKKNKTKQKEAEKNVSLRISKQNELKPEIKKIKKQETEKKEFKPKDYVVYPKHGVGKITAVEKANIGQIDIQFYKIFIEKETVFSLRESKSLSLTIFGLREESF